MMNKRLLPGLSLLFFVLTVALVFASWMGSIYGQDTFQSLLSEDGIRWALKHVVGNYVHSPLLGILLVLFMGVGVGWRSGMYHALIRFLSRKKLLSGKERRAMMSVIVVVTGYVLSVFMAVPFLKSITGGFARSPFLEGLAYIISVGLGVSGMVYGYAINAFRSLNDVFRAMSCLIAECADWLVCLFFIVQFFSVLAYSGIGHWLFNF